MREYSIGDVVELQVYGEECCEICNEIIHNRIDCPVCKSVYAATDQYCDLEDEKELTCQFCGTTFEKTSEYWYYQCTAKIVYLTNKNLTPCEPS